MKNLNDVLENKEFYEKFRHFCVKALSIENLLFYERVEQFRKSQNKIKEANYIIKNFILEDSQFQINLDYNFVQKIIIDIEKAHFETIFEAEKIILSQLNEDIFPRFIKSKETQQDIDELTTLKQNIETLSK